MAIANRYAVSTNHKIVNFCTDKDGYAYYHTNYATRPRYLGLSHIIKIDDNGEMSYVHNHKERFWAYEQAVKRDNFQYPIIIG